MAAISEDGPRVRRDEFFNIIDTVNFYRNRSTGVDLMRKILDFCEKQLKTQEVPRHHLEAYYRAAIGNYSDKIRLTNHDQAVEYVNTTLGVIQTFWNPNIE